MRVLYVAHSGEPYGATRSLFALVVEARRRGVEPLVVTQLEGDLCGWLETAGIPWTLVPSSWWAAPHGERERRAERARAGRHASRTVAGLAREFGADLVHTNASVTGLGHFAARRARLPHVWHLREYGTEDWGLEWDFGAARTRAAIRGAAACLASSRALFEHFVGGEPTATHRVLHDGIGPEAELAARADGGTEKNGRFTFVLAGLVAVNKGQEEAIRAFAGATARGGAEAELWIVGGGDSVYRARCEALCAELGVAAGVRFLGHVEDVFPLLRRAHAALMCSPSEAFGRVTVEAMSCGLPVIGNAGGATPELVAHGRDGVVYRDGAEGLARAMRLLLDEPDLAAWMGANARRAALHFSDERCAAEVVDVYLAVLARGDPARLAAAVQPAT